VWHTIFIALHATAGVAALAAGAITLRGGRFFDVYLGSLIVMTVSLVAAIGVEWAAIDTVARVVFSAFTVLAGVMIWQATRARQLPPGSATYIEHIGFTLISLFDAFVLVAVLNAGAPIWLVVGAGVVIAVAGHYVLRWTKHTFPVHGR
jgi:hypothetical protein